MMVYQVLFVLYHSQTMEEKVFLIYIYVCMYVCMYVRIYVYVYIFNISIPLVPFFFLFWQIL